MAILAWLRVYMVNGVVALSLMVSISDARAQAMACVESAIAALGKAKKAEAVSDVGNATAAVGTGTATLSAQGTQQVQAAMTSSAQASANSAACTSAANAANAQGAACMNANAQAKDFKQAKAMWAGKFTTLYQKTVTKCSGNVAGGILTSNNLQMAGMAMSMMSAMGSGEEAAEESDFGGDFGVGGAPGGGLGSGSGITSGTPMGTTAGSPTNALTKANPTNTTTNGAPPPKVTAFKPDLGEADDLDIDELDDDDSGSMVSMASLGADFSDEDMIENHPGPIGERGIASQPETEDDLAGETSSRSLGSRGSGFTPFDFSDPNSPGAVKPEEAKDNNYLGKNGKTKQSLAAMLVEKKKAETEAKETKRSLAMANAQKIAEEFRATSKSCAERQWKGKQCQALRADPLLNVE